MFLFWSENVIVVAFHRSVIFYNCDTGICSNAFTLRIAEFHIRDLAFRQNGDSRSSPLRNNFRKRQSLTLQLCRREQQHGDGEEEPEPRQPVTLRAETETSLVKRFSLMIQKPCPLDKVRGKG
jgi:hypothetical protein